jgi:hypothetical protein
MEGASYTEGPYTEGPYTEGPTRGGAALPGTGAALPGTGAALPGTGEVLAAHHNPRGPVHLAGRGVASVTLRRPGLALVAGVLEGTEGAAGDGHLVPSEEMAGDGRTPNARRAESVHASSDVEEAAHAWKPKGIRT